MSLFDFTKGTLSITVDKFDFSLGDFIEGTVSLKLKNKLEAKALTVRLVCEKEYEGRDSKGHIQKTVHRLFDFAVPLDGEKEYDAEEKSYHFKIGIPQEKPVDAAVDTAITAMPELLAKMVNAIAASSKITMYWFLEARLDVPWAVDLTEKVQINVT